MPRPRAEEDGRLTASQVVAHNLSRARELRGLTQTEVAERLARFTGARWSQATVAQAEGSVRGQRMRQFTANELVALARTFDVPILYFFMPPDGAGGRLVTEDRPAGLPCEYLLALLFGHEDNFSILADRTANWAHLLINGVDAPLSDILLDPGEAGSASSRTTATVSTRRHPFLPEDVLAAAFHGLAARRVRGAKRPGEELAAFAENLRGLADALTAFNNYRPGHFVDEEIVAEVADERRARQQRLKDALEAEDDE